MPWYAELCRRGRLLSVLLSQQCRVKPDNCSRILAIRSAARRGTSQRAVTPRSRFAIPGMGLRGSPFYIKFHPVR